MIARLLSCVIPITVLAACAGSGAPIPTQTPLQSGREAAPLQPPPPWIEPAAVITRDNVAEIQLLGRLDTTGRASTVFAYAFSPDATQLAALNNDQFLLWDVITGQLMANTARQGASFIFFAPDKSEIYTVDSDGIALIYDASIGRVKSDLRAHPDFNGAADFHHDKGWIVLGGVDGSVKVWDPLDRISLVTIDAHQREINWVLFSPDGDLLATSGEEGIVTVWNWREREEITTINNAGRVPVRGAFSPDGAHLALGMDSTIDVWSLSDGERVRTLETGRGGSSDTLMYSPDGRYLINGGAIPDMLVWDAQSGELVARLPGIGGNRTSAVFSPDGDLLLVSVLDGPVTLWDMTSISDEAVVRADLQVGTNRVLYVDWTDDGFLMLFFDALGPIYVWGIGPQQ
jgi:WD40 repeat protein